MTFNIEIIIVAVVAAIPGLILAIVALRKQPAETRSADAAADKAQHEASQSIAQGAKTLAESLCNEVAGLRTELETTKKRLAESDDRANTASRLVESLRQRLGEAEGRLAKAESGTVDAEKRALEVRTDLIKVGTMLDKDRREHQRQIDELVLVIQTLVDQVERLGGKPNIDRATLEKIANLSRRD